MLFFISLKYNLLQFELLKILIHLNIYYNVKKSTETSEFHTLLIKVKKYYFSEQKESEKLHVNEEKFMDLDKQIKSLGMFSLKWLLKKL